MCFFLTCHGELDPWPGGIFDIEEKRDCGGSNQHVCVEDRVTLTPGWHFKKYHEDVAHALWSYGMASPPCPAGMLSVQDWSLQCPSNMIWPFKTYPMKNEAKDCLTLYTYVYSEALLKVWFRMKRWTYSERKESNVCFRILRRYKGVYDYVFGNKK